MTQFQTTMTRVLAARDEALNAAPEERDSAFSRLDTRAQEFISAGGPPDLVTAIKAQVQSAPAVRPKSS
jgi:hypothetical protein